MMNSYDKWFKSPTNTPTELGRKLLTEADLVNVDKLSPDSVLVLAFQRPKKSFLFTKKLSHVDVEIFIVPTPPPTTREPGSNAKSYDFTAVDILAVRVDKSDGVRCSVKRNYHINGETYDTLCIPLTHSEKQHIVEFVHTIKDCKYNAMDDLFGQTISKIANFMVSDPHDPAQCNQENPAQDYYDIPQNTKHTITRLHSGQLVTLIIQNCLHDKRVTSKMWGYKSRFTSPHEIYKELAGICVVINPDAFRQGYIQAWGVGVSRTGPNRC